MDLGAAVDCRCCRIQSWCADDSGLCAGGSVAGERDFHVNWYAALYRTAPELQRSSGHVLTSQIASSRRDHHKVHANLRHWATWCAGSYDTAFEMAFPLIM